MEATDCVTASGTLAEKQRLERIEVTLQSTCLICDATRLHLAARQGPCLEHIVCLFLPHMYQLLWEMLPSRSAEAEEHD